nr:actin filament-associated protein 1-like 1 [Oncorhynchus nerka]
MASQPSVEETLSLRHGFRCVPENGVNVEEVLLVVGDGRDWGLATGSRGLFKTLSLGEYEEVGGKALYNLCIKVSNIRSLGEYEGVGGKALYNLCIKLFPSSSPLLHFVLFPHPSFLQPGKDGGPKQRSSFTSSDSGRTKPGLALKRTGSNTNQYGLYGKTRAEEDAKLFLREKEHLERERDGIRTTLLTLRQERREVKERFKTASEEQKGSLSERVSQLEETCRGKESERVNLELRLTQVKDNLKKSLAGGALGAPGESKPSSKVYSRPYYSESIPVSCVSAVRVKHPVYSTSKRTVMQKAKEWESKKCT